MADVVYMSSASVYGVVLNHDNNVSLTVFTFFAFEGTMKSNLKHLNLSNSVSGTTKYTVCMYMYVYIQTLCQKLKKKVAFIFICLSTLKAKICTIWQIAANLTI